MGKYINVRVRQEDYQYLCEVQRIIKNIGTQRAGELLKIKLDPDQAMTKIKTVRLCAMYTAQALRWGI